MSDDRPPVPRADDRLGGEDATSGIDGHPGGRPSDAAAIGPAALVARVVVPRGELTVDVALDAGPGEVVALLGPNGSGKTTVLHALAGLVPLTEGAVTLGDTPLDDPAADTFVVPEHRPVSLVFQDYLLFPHLSALENVAFGPRAAGVPADAARAEARTWLARFGLEDVADRRPRHLSGGQAQRVALARALVTRPSLLLLDEPLAALDAGTRDLVRRDLRRHLADFGGTTVLVTHDPLDALALASRVVVLDTGAVVQAGPIAELTARPRSRYVADLVGLNLLEGTAAPDGHGVVVAPDLTLTVADPVDGHVFVLVHPTAVAVHTAEPSGSPRNHWPATIEGFDLLGDRVRVRLTGAVAITAEVTAASLAALGLHEGMAVWAAVKATEVRTYPR